MTLRRAGHVPAAGLWPRTLIVIFTEEGSGGVKHAFLSVKFKIFNIKIGVGVKHAFLSVKFKIFNIKI